MEPPSHPRPVLYGISLLVRVSPNTFYISTIEIYRDVFIAFDTLLKKLTETQLNWAAVCLPGILVEIPAHFIYFHFGFLMDLSSLTNCGQSGWRGILAQCECHKHRAGLDYELSWFCHTRLILQCHPSWKYSNLALFSSRTSQPASHPSPYLGSSILCQPS